MYKMKVGNSYAGMGTSFMLENGSKSMLLAAERWRRLLSSVGVTDLKTYPLNLFGAPKDLTIITGLRVILKLLFMNCQGCSKYNQFWRCLFTNQHFL